MQPFTDLQPTSRTHETGMTLIELMVALAIGMFLMIGAITVFSQSRTAFRVTESVSRLQENARVALDILEPDIRMAHYWGMTTRSYNVDGRKGTTTPVASPAACGAGWTIDLDHAVEGTNAGYTWPAGTCGANGTASATSDTLVVRRASELLTTALQGNTIYIQSARAQPGQLFVGTALPAGFTACTLTPPSLCTSQTHQLIVNGYYVNHNTATDVWSLRRKTLGVGPTITDEEIIPGVEDLQVQFGVDTDLPDTPNRGSIDRYVNANDAILNPTDPSYLPNAEILAVRIWLRLRAERPEQGFTDNTNYIYADQNVGPFNDNIRRFVVSKTIYLRNARPAS